MNELDVTGLDEAEVLAALFNHAGQFNPLSLGFSTLPMTAEEAQEHLRERLSFDALKGRRLRIDLSQSPLQVIGYDQANGDGAARAALADLLAQRDERHRETLRDELDAIAPMGCGYVVNDPLGDHLASLAELAGVWRTQRNENRESAVVREALLALIDQVPVLVKAHGKHSP